MGQESMHGSLCPQTSTCSPVPQLSHYEAILALSWSQSYWSGNALSSFKCKTHAWCLYEQLTERRASVYGEGQTEVPGVRSRAFLNLLSKQLARDKHQNLAEHSVHFSPDGNEH